MSRGLCVLAALAILAGGCASRRAVDRLESEVGRLGSELAEMRVAQEATSRGVATITSQLQSLDIPALGDEVGRLSRRADANEMAIAATRTQVEALTPSTGGSGAPTPAPTPAPAGTTRVPAPLPPSSAVTSPVPPPLPPGPTGTAPVPAPAPSGRASISPPPAPAPPPAATMLPPPTLSPTSSPPPAAIPPSAAVEKPRVTPPPAPVVPPAATTATPAKPAQKAGGNPEQEYAAALATYRAREHGQAVIDFLDFIAKYPKHPLAGNAQYWIGEAYWAQRDYRQALVEFEKVFEHGPQKAPDAQLKIGLCYLRLGDVPRAQQAWQRVVNDYPKSESAGMARSLIATHSTVRR
jgi:tol-pal system protein YbgF